MCEAHSCVVPGLTAKGCVYRPQSDTHSSSTPSSRTGPPGESCLERNEFIPGPARANLGFPGKETLKRTITVQVMHSSPLASQLQVATAPRDQSGATKRLCSSAAM